QIDAGVDGRAHGGNAFLVRRGAPEHADAAATERQYAHGRERAERMLLHNPAPSAAESQGTTREVVAGARCARHDCVMTLDQILAFALFAFVISITPGPNNTMVLASGANFGLRPTIPHLLGIDLGFALMIVAVGSGIGGLFTTLPELQTGLRYVG